jgi:hypothetical protein
MDRQLGLFEKEGTRPVKDRPEQSEEPQCPVRQMLFVLPLSVETPMAISTPEVRSSTLIPFEAKLFQLRNGDRERIADSL